MGVSGMPVSGTTASLDPYAPLNASLGDVAMASGMPANGNTTSLEPYTTLGTTSLITFPALNDTLGDVVVSSVPTAWNTTMTTTAVKVANDVAASEPMAASASAVLMANATCLAPTDVHGAADISCKEGVLIASGGICSPVCTLGRTTSKKTLT